MQSCGGSGEGERDPYSDLETGYEVTGLFVPTALIDMYAKCGRMENAQNLFDALATRSIVTWSALIAGYANQGESEVVFDLFERMRLEGVQPNGTIFLSILTVCSHMGLLDKGQKYFEAMIKDYGIVPTVLHFTPPFSLHSPVLTSLSRSPLQQGSRSSCDVGSILVHVYGRCGSMLEAQEVFDVLSEHEVVSWTAMIAGYARQGNWKASLQSYADKQLEAVEPNGVQFLALLSACSHAGLADKGVELFESISKDHYIVPEHYTSVVDLLGRAGYFKSVEKLLSDMPVHPEQLLLLVRTSSCAPLMPTCQPSKAILMTENARPGLP